MKRVLVIAPDAKHEPGLVKRLAIAGYNVGISRTVSEARLHISAADADFVGVVLSWPEQVDDEFEALLSQLTSHDLSHLAILLLAHDVSAKAVAWLKKRRRSALLLWSDCSEAPDAIERLVKSGSSAGVELVNDMSDHHLRVLFVDDSPTVRIAFRRLLMRHGLLVETAASVAEGLRKAKHQHFDLAIIDYFMPEQNGVVLVKQLKSDPKTAHIMSAIITGTYSDVVIDDALAAGAAECIFKNEAKELFLTRVASLANTIVHRQSIERERRRLHGILQSVGDGVYGVDESGLIQFANPAVCEILDFEDESDLVNMDAFRLFHSRSEDGSDLSRENCFLSQCYERGNQVSGWQATFWSQSGRAIPVECSVYPLEIEGERRGSVVAFRDISARKQLEEELRWQATHDALTKLYNRSHFEEELEKEIKRLRRSDNSSALLFIDLDRFKYINDTAGHAAGDRLLVEVADRLKRRLRMSDLLARIGGDEYAIILRNIPDKSVLSAADQFRAALEDTPFIHGEKQYLVSATIGVAPLDKNTISMGEAMANADIACHLAKSRGRNRVHVFSSESDEKAAMDMELGWSARLKTALAEDQFVLRYQPIMATEAVNFDAIPQGEDSVWQGTNRRQGEIPLYEVLLRLEDAEGGLIAPDAFLPTAERFNMMVDVDHWVVENAIRRLSELATAGVDCRFSINLSEQSILDESTPEFVKSCIAKHAVDAERITFELAETRALANMEAAQRFVSAIRALGCHCALDDFGTGFASFIHLKHLEVDYLKIDGAYLRSMSRDPINVTVLSSIAKIAHALGKQTVAESVDSPAVLKALRDCGIDQLQGYFIGRPQAQVDGASDQPKKPAEPASNVTQIQPRKTGSDPQAG